MRILTLFCLSFFSLISLGASIPADMSFIVIDLKYNQNDGVKVCEIQQGLGCVFYGVEHIEGKKNAFGEIFCDYLFPYFQRNWYVRPRISPEITSILKKSPNWTRLFSFDEVVTKQEIKKYAQTKVKDPSSLRRRLLPKLASDVISLVQMRRRDLKSKGNPLPKINS